MAEDAGTGFIIMPGERAAAPAARPKLTPNCAIVGERPWAPTHRSARRGFGQRAEG
jgi:hypothetical protein